MKVNKQVAGSHGYGALEGNHSLGYGDCWVEGVDLVQPVRYRGSLLRKAGEAVSMEDRPSWGAGLEVCRIHQSITEGIQKEFQPLKVVCLKAEESTARVGII